MCWFSRVTLMVANRVRVRWRSLTMMSASGIGSLFVVGGMLFCLGCSLDVDAPFVPMFSETEQGRVLDQGQTSVEA